MPRKSSIQSLADEQAAPGGAAAVDRALSVLSAFRPGDKALSVTELAERTRLYKSTVLRLLVPTDACRKFMIAGVCGFWSSPAITSRMRFPAANYLAAYL